MMIIDLMSLTVIINIMDSWVLGRLVGYWLGIAIGTLPTSYMMMSHSHMNKNLLQFDYLYQISESQ